MAGDYFFCRTLYTAGRISCRNLAINSRLLSCFTARCDDRRSSAVCIPLLAHMSSHKTSMRRNLTTAIVFDELVVKGEQAHQRRCMCHHMLCRRYRQTQMTPHQQLGPLKLASFQLAAGLE